MTQTGPHFHPLVLLVSQAPRTTAYGFPTRKDRTQPHKQRRLFENELGFMTLLILNHKIISITTNQVLPITTHQSRTYHSRLVSIYQKNYTITTHQPQTFRSRLVSIYQKNYAIITRQSRTYHSPLSSETHRSLFVELAKRGEQGVESAILFASFHLMIWCNLLLKITNIALRFITYHAVFLPISLCK